MEVENEHVKEYKRLLDSGDINQECYDKLVEDITNNTIRTRPKLTDEERAVKKKERSKIYYHRNKNRLNANRKAKKLMESFKTEVEQSTQ